MTQQPIVEKSIEIAATPDRVWRVLTEPDQVVQWMNGAHVESTWEAGSDMTFTWIANFDKTVHDRATLLAIERGKFLQYSHWSGLSLLPDKVENRTLMTFSLEPMDGGTLLTVRNENFESDVAYKHANFFWSVAVAMVKKVAEQ